MADAIICISESSKRDLLEYYAVDKARVFVVHLGFTPLESNGNVAPASIERPYLLFVGFRGTYKNFAALLQAYADSGVARDYDLVAVGGGRFSVEELSAAKKLGVEAKLQNFVGVSDSALGAFYRNASLFVYPSLHEGFGFPPLEAMSMGCPVLVGDNSSLPEVCGNAAFYFHGGDLSRALVEALNDERSRLIMTKRGYDRQSCFKWPTCAAETYAIYNHVLTK